MQLSPSSSKGSLHKRHIGNVPDPLPWKAVWLRETTYIICITYITYIFIMYTILVLWAHSSIATIPTYPTLMMSSIPSSHCTYVICYLHQLWLFVVNFHTILHLSFIFTAADLSHVIVSFLLSWSYLLYEHVQQSWNYVPQTNAAHRLVRVWCVAACSTAEMHM